MWRPSVRWRQKLREAAALCVGVLLAAQGAWAVPPASWGTYNPITDAQNTGTAALGGRYDSPNALMNNAVRPIQGNTQMTTTNGVQSFDGHVNCPDEGVLLEIFAAPGATGDLSSVVAAADLDLDGTFDSSVTAPAPVSGVCGNGFITCNVGTWNNCGFWRWNATAGAIGYESVALDQLSGCYCINNSCNSNLAWNNLPTLLGDLSSGVLQPVLALDARYVVSRNEVTNTSMRVYGMSTASCGAGNSNLQSIAAAPATMSTRVAAEVATQSAGPNSVYSLVTNSGLATSESTTSSSCTIQRNVTSQLITTPIGTDLGTATSVMPLLGYDLISVLVEAAGPTAAAVRVQTGGWCNPGYGTTNTSAGLTLRANQPVTVSNQGIINVPNAPTHVIFDAYQADPGRFLASTYSRRGCAVILQSGSCSDTQCTLGIRLIDEYVGDDSYYANVDRTHTFTFPLLQDLQLTETISDTCQGYDSSDLCRLRNETVDGVRTYQNYQPTNLVPLPSTRTWTGGGMSESLTRDWWRKDRTYTCNAAPGQYDFTDALHRADVVTRTANIGTGYRDVTRNQAGNWVSRMEEFGEPSILPTVEPCERACKVRKTIMDDRVASTGVTSENRQPTPATRYEYGYYTCTDNVCPTQTGETVIKACQCLNEFAEAATIMQIMRQAGQDLLCTQ